MMAMLIPPAMSLAGPLAPWVSTVPDDGSARRAPGALPVSTPALRLQTIPGPADDDEDDEDDDPPDRGGDGNIEPDDDEGGDDDDDDDEEPWQVRTR
jgi:hypothetical protein